MATKSHANRDGLLTALISVGLRPKGRRAAPKGVCCGSGGLFSFKIIYFYRFYMQNIYRPWLLLAAFIVAAIPMLVNAHSGNTDSKGGHYCWTNCEQYGLKTGEYHYHDAQGNNVRTLDNNGKIYDQKLTASLHGKILLQVQERGEAWYVRKSDSLRYYMKNGE
jgi:hypothetical protein